MKINIVSFTIRLFFDCLFAVCLFDRMSVCLFVSIVFNKCMSFI